MSSGDARKILGAYALVVLAFGCGVLWWQSFACSRKWAASGMAISWPVQGCLVEVAPGRWWPDERVREIDPALP